MENTNLFFAIPFSRLRTRVTNKITFSIEESPDSKFLKLIKKIAFNDSNIAHKTEEKLESSKVTRKPFPSIDLAEIWL